ncbi:flagellar biosynthesis protein [Betaproteobacteria bacterium]|nr:flagellar biosynthesis protein [Betaproteobacteria bacterium]
MAKEAKPVEAAPPQSGSKKLLIIIAVLAVLLVVGGAGAFFMMRSHGGDEDAEEEEAVVEAPKSRKKKSAPPVYVPMDAFTVNLVPEASEQFVQLIISVEVLDVQAGEQLKTYTPKIRNNVMMLLSSKKASELLTKEGKEKLAEEIRDQMNKVLDPRADKDEWPVKEVLFTSFIIQ